MERSTEPVQKCRQRLTPRRHSIQMAEAAISGHCFRRLADLLRRVENCYHSFKVGAPPGKSRPKGGTGLPPRPGTAWRGQAAATMLIPNTRAGRTPMIVRILIGVLTMAATLATATAASAHDESKYPDWSGQWRWNAMGGGPRYDPSKPAGAAQQAP